MPVRCASKQAAALVSSGAPSQSETVSLIFVLGVAVAVGASIGRWWAAVLPLVISGVVTALLAARGHGVADTPIAFFVLVATAAVTVGVLLRRRSSRTPTLP